ncbi:MAG: baseplate J/gp47 family protein, partial [Beijerinckiaceae bacterium]
MGLGGFGLTCTLKRPAPQTLFDRVKNLFSANVLGGADVIPESNEWYVVQNDYATQEMYYSLAEQMWRERDPRYACCDNLVEMAARDGIYPRPAAHAQGYVKVTGTAGSAIPSTFNVTSGGQTYTVAPGAILPTVVPTTLTFTARVMAVDAGSAGNGLGTTAGRITTSIPGISQDVQVCGGYFCGGSDAETCEEFRQR